MDLTTVLLKSHNGVSFITLNRPENFNALDFQLGDELIAALETCRKDINTRAVVITGAGKAFCSGGDLKMAREHVNTEPAEPYRQLTKSLNRIIIEIRSLHKPVIAAINGAVGGAGLSIAAACDLRIASRNAKFKQAYTSTGLTPDGAWTLLIPLLIGFGKANELLYLDPVLDANEALKIGIINELVEPEQLELRAIEMAEAIAKGPTHSYSIIKGLVNNSLLFALERQLELERQGIMEAAVTLDYKEGINAFFEKRTPQFIGK
ncbi:MAG: enoyl-CoA hydratase-related protein [Negativicutes bacterium]|nr:enoyl-CoA hydratase-related protein [Negativicutes bacterium]